MTAWRVPMMVPTYGTTEIQAVQSVLESRAVTQGELVHRFERRFMEHIGVLPSSRALMVNSGSSANLLAARTLRQLVSPQRPEGWRAEHGRKPEVITPAVTWSTTVAPLIQMGFKPVFVDVGPDLQIDPERVEEAITEETVAIVPVHLAGWPADMTSIMGLAHEHGLEVWEDACESLGAKWDGVSVGTFGAVGTFSFYFSHHLSTVEGGLLVLNVSEHRPFAWREHGWTRLYPGRLAINLAWDPDLDSRWVFDDLGFNLRSTELNAAMGLVQLDRQGGFAKRRREIAAEYLAALDPSFGHLPWEPRAEPNPFSYPLLIAPGARERWTRRAVTEYLSWHGVDSRPPMSGNIVRHPWYQRHPEMYRVHGSLKWADEWHKYGVLLPIHPFMSRDDVLFVADTLNEAVVLHDSKGAIA